MRADRYLPWHVVRGLNRRGTGDTHDAESSGRVPIAPAETLEGGCLLYRLRYVADRPARTTIPAASSGHSGGGD